MNERAIAMVIDAVARQNFSEAERQLEALLADHWRNPAVCHLAGVFHLRRALAAEATGNNDVAATHWRKMVPHLAYALESPAYLQSLRVARERAYGQSIDPEKLEGSRQDAYLFVEERLKAIEQQCAQSERDVHAQRLREIHDLWRLELVAARKVNQFGGIPDGDAPARCIVAGPMFARQYGFFERAEAYIANIPVRELSLIEELMEIFLGKSAGIETGPTPRLKREVGYCFSRLALPFLYYQEGKSSQALEALRTYVPSGQERVQEMAGEAAKFRNEARQLAAEIRVAVGTDYLRRGGEYASQAMDLWEGALKDMEILDRAAPGSTRRQLPTTKARMRDLVRQRVNELMGANQWDEAQSLSEGIARAIPDSETLRDLKAVLVRRAFYSVNELGDDAAALVFLRRARLLSPEDKVIQEHLLNIMGKRVQDLRTAGNHRAAAEMCMDIHSLAIEMLREQKAKEAAKPASAKPGKPQDDLPERARMTSLHWLNELLEKLAHENDKEFAQFVYFFLTEMIESVLKDPDGQNYNRIEAVRLARRAQERAIAGDVIEAFTDINQALQHSPDDDRLAKLYEALAAHVVNHLCDQGAVDQAAEIAEKAARAVKDSDPLQRCLARVHLRRLKPEKLASEDPEEIAGVVTNLETWLGKDPDQSIQDKGKRYAAVIDRDINNEIEMERVTGLMNANEHRLALELIHSLDLRGMDAARAKYFAAKCHSHLGDLTSAIAVTEELVRDYPFSLCRHLRGQMLSLAGRFERADEDFEFCREHDAENYDVVRSLAFNSYRARRYEDALYYLALARENGLRGSEIILMEAVAHMHLKQENEIAHVLKYCTDSDLNDPWYVLLFRWSAGEATDDDVLQAAEQTPAEPSQLRLRHWTETYFYLAEKARASGRLDVARRYLAECVKINLHTDYEFQHAWALMNAERLK